METNNKKRTIKPCNQKAVYHSAAEVFEKIMNDEIDIAKGEVANNLLSQMNRAYALEIKRSEILRNPIRVIESKNFEEDHIINSPTMQP